MRQGWQYGTVRYVGTIRYAQRWARSPSFGDLDDQDQIIKKM